MKFDLGISDHHSYNPNYIDEEKTIDIITLNPLRLILLEYLFQQVSESQRSVFDEYSSLKYFQRRELITGQVLYEVGDSANEFFIIEKGAVEIVNTSGSPSNRDEQYGSVERVYKMSSGAICGEAEFLLRKPYRLSIVLLNYKFYNDFNLIVVRIAMLYQ